MVAILDVCSDVQVIPLAYAFHCIVVELFCAWDNFVHRTYDRRRFIGW
jgi:hypothetical protein